MGRRAVGHRTVGHAAGRGCPARGRGWAVPRWEPLPDTIGTDARRLAAHLRRMKDRSGLGVPVVAARTARGTDEWMRYLNGLALPPLDAVEVLGQLSGADPGRLTALWELAGRSWAD